LQQRFAHNNTPLIGIKSPVAARAPAGSGVSFPSANHRRTDIAPHPFGKQRDPIMADSLEWFCVAAEFKLGNDKLGDERLHHFHERSG